MDLDQTPHTPAPTPDLVFALSRETGMTTYAITKVLKATRAAIEHGDELLAADLRGYLAGRTAMNRHFTVEQVAERLGVSRTWLWRMCRRGDVPHVRVGGGRGMVRLTEANVAAIQEHIAATEGSYHAPKRVTEPAR